MMAKKAKRAKLKTAKARPSPRKPKGPPAEAHTYGDGAHTIGNLTIHGIAHYNTERKAAIAAWLREMARVIEAEGTAFGSNPPIGETFAARFNVRNL